MSLNVCACVCTYVCITYVIHVYIGTYIYCVYIHKCLILIVFVFP